jgi:hypothetical protein
MTDLRQVAGRGGNPVQYAIKVIHRNGQENLLADHGGVMTFITREHAERLTHRLAACADASVSYEVIEQPR